jgi:hypothetical protein
LLITQKLRVRGCPRSKGLNARGPSKVHPKWRLEESALAHRALAPIRTHITAREADAHQRPS